MAILKKAQSNFILGDVGNPTDTVESFFLDADQDCVRLGLNAVKGFYEGHWDEYLILVEWLPDNDFISLRVDFIHLLNPINKHKMIPLIQKLNTLVDIGCFCIDEGQNAPHFYYGFYDLSAASSAALISTVLKEVIDTINQFYPAFDAVITGQLGGEEAATLANLRPIGQS